MRDERPADAQPMSIHDVLAQYASDCPALTGAVVATPDGLVLGATPSFAGDTSAAAAASLSVHLDQDLNLLLPAQLSEGLLWTDAGVWYLRRLGNGQVLMAYAEQPAVAGALRLAGQAASARLGLISAVET